MLPHFYNAPAPTRKQPPRAPPTGRTWAGVALFLLIGPACVLWGCWTATWGTNDQYKFVATFIPALGAVGFVVTPVLWLRDRKRDFLGAPRRRAAYLAFFISSGLWAASWPAGEMVIRASAAASQDRVGKVAEAVREFRRVKGRWPDSWVSLESFAGRSWPEPTLGTWFMLEFPAHDDFGICFISRSPWSETTWTYDVMKEVWSEADQD